MALTHAEGFRFLPGAGSKTMYFPATTAGSSLVWDSANGPYPGVPSIGSTHTSTSSSANLTTYQYRLFPRLGPIVANDEIGFGCWFYAENNISFELYITSVEYFFFSASAGSAPSVGDSDTGMTDPVLVDPTPIDFPGWHWLSWTGRYQDPTTGWFQIYVDGTLRATQSGDTADPINTDDYRMSIYLGNDEYATRYSPSYLRRISSMVIYDHAVPDQPIPAQRVDVVTPTADAVQGWLPSAGSDHYPLVANAGTEPLRDDTSYVSATTSPLDDTYTFEPISHDVVSVNGVMVSATSSNTSPDPRTVATLCNGTAGPDIDPNTQPHLETMHTVNPATGLAWTKSEVNAMTAGVRAVT